jgi:beta-galactosidase/beta-glucuronidase
MQNSRSAIRWTSIFFAILSLLNMGVAISSAAESRQMMLSGHGKDDPVQWDFMCNGGMNANKWSTIGVPSNWELQGFGVYEYGRPVPKDGWSKVQGKYKRTFTPPAGWSDQKVFIVFEGVMTDTQVFINGASAGPMHQGGYYQFQYNISKLLKFGQENLLEVTVDDESANASINSAERRGDYWNYSGIFRPVYLQADPQQSIDRVAIDANADGTFAADVYLNGNAPTDQATGWSVEGQVMDTTGAPVGAAFSQPRGAADSRLVQPAGTSRRAARIWEIETGRRCPS